MSDAIDFWFSTGSTYTYLTVSRLEKVAAAQGVCFKWRPFSVRAIMREQNNIPFANKPIALQSATGGPLGGARVQYHLRQCMVFLDGLVFNRPEIFVGVAQQKFDEKTLELKDQATIDIIKQQLAGFEKFIRRVSGKN